MQVIRSPKVYDAVIIGSGAGGGMAAMVLTRGGLKCALLEGGPSLDPSRDYKEHLWPYDLTYRGNGPGYKYDEVPVVSEFNDHLGGWQPYTVAEGQQFLWFRSRILGGRTNIWGRISLRFAPYDFKPHSTDGRGADWPISYEDVAPYYDRVERLIGVFGNRDGFPTVPDGIYQPPPPPRCYERLVAKGCGKLGIPTIALRNAILTRDHDGRAACHYCNQCGRGCMTASRFSSVQVLIPKALATKRLTLIPNAMAREILTDEEGRCMDELGIPVLRIHWEWGEEERNMARHAQQTMEEIVEASGGCITRRQKGISVGGEIIHEVGTARMGDDSCASVLNAFNQAHDVKNLFVVDGAAFSSSPEKNPTLTILSLSMRASEYLLEEARKGNL